MIFNLKYLIVPFLSLLACSHNTVSEDPAPPARKLVWSDEFNYTGLPDPSKWDYEKGFVRNQEPQYYTSKRLENCRVDNGMLIIKASKEKYKTEKGDTASYTSASIITLGKQAWQYGRIEVRAKLPKGKGTWPAIWMLGENRTQVNWPKCGEIDIMEFLGKDPATVYATMHYADSAGKHASKGGKTNVGDASTDFHVYAIDWNQDRIDFYYDELRYFTFDLKNADIGKENAFRKKAYLLLNLALGREGSWPGPTNDNILPIEYLVDYVRVYQ